jgi:hypothetical protein
MPRTTTRSPRRDDGERDRARARAPRPRQQGNQPFRSGKHALGGGGAGGEGVEGATRLPRAPADILSHGAEPREAPIDLDDGLPAARPARVTRPATLVAASSRHTARPQGAGARARNRALAARGCRWRPVTDSRTQSSDFSDASAGALLDYGHHHTGRSTGGRAAEVARRGERRTGGAAIGAGLCELGVCARLLEDYDSL